MAESHISADAIKEIERLIKASITPQIVQMPGEPGRFRIFSAGTLGDEQTFRTAERHSESFLSVDALAEFLKDRSEQGGEDQTVWIDGLRVKYVHDFADRRDHGEVELRRTEALQFLAENSARKFNQRDFLRLLRINLAGCLPADSGLLGLLRNLRFSGASEAVAAVQHGKESIDKQVRAAVSGESALPEIVLLTLRLFTNGSHRRHTIVCALEVFPQEQLFAITPLPEELPAALENEYAEIGAMLKTYCPVYYGCCRCKGD